MSRIIGAIAALIVWVLAIVYFLLNPQRRSSKENAILRIMKVAVKDWEKEQKLAKQSFTSHNLVLGSNIIANDPDIMRESEKKQWDEAQENSWEEKDIGAWEEEEEHNETGETREDVDSTLSVIELKKQINFPDVTKHLGINYYKKQTVNKGQLGHESKNYPYLEVKPQTPNLYHNFLREELYEPNRQSSSGPSMVECQVRYPHNSKFLPYRTDDLSDLDETVESPRAVLYRSLGNGENHSSALGSNPQPIWFGSLRGSGKEVIHEPLKDFSDSPTAAILRRKSDSQLTSMPDRSRSKVNISEATSDSIKRLPLLSACQSEPLASKHRRLRATAMINREQVDRHPVPAIRRKPCGIDLDAGSPAEGSSTLEQQRFSISRGSKRKFYL